MSETMLEGTPPPVIRGKVVFNRPFKKKRQKIRGLPSNQLAALNRAYMSGLADGLQGLQSHESLYPNTVAGRYALGYTRGRGRQ